MILIDWSIAKKEICKYSFCFVVSVEVMLSTFDSIILRSAIRRYVIVMCLCETEENTAKKIRETLIWSKEGQERNRAREKMIKKNKSMLRIKLRFGSARARPKPNKNPQRQRNYRYERRAKHKKKWNKKNHFERYIYVRSIRVRRSLFTIILLFLQFQFLFKWPERERKRAIFDVVFYISFCCSIVFVSSSPMPTLFIST